MDRITKGYYRAKDTVEVIEVKKDKLILRDPNNKLDIWPINKRIFKEIYEKAK